MQHLQSNTTLQGGKYRIERVLGQGGFGITYLALQMSLQRKVAIKELFLNGVNERAVNSVQVSNSVNTSLFEKQKEKFKKEAKRLMSLDNEHIVKVYDLFEENNTAYYVMDYLEGESLASKMKREGHPLQEIEVMDILPQLLDALSEIHKHQIWHLDIKPGNIMLKDKTVVLIDFGASKQITPSEMTSTALYFTPGYAPAEQTGMLFNQFGPWTDLYAVGATLFNLLTGKSPLEFDIEEVNDDDVPDNFEGLMHRLINRLMQPRRKDRLQNTNEVRQMYYSGIACIGVLTITKDVLNREIVRAKGEDVDFVKDLGATKKQIENIKNEINEMFGVSVEGYPMTYHCLAVAIMQQLGWIFDIGGEDSEEATDEDYEEYKNLVNEQNKILKERGEETLINNYSNTDKDMSGKEMLALLAEDKERGVLLVKKYADAGNIDAQMILASVYQIGAFGEEHRNDAAYYYRMAADQGFAPAQAKLALCYLRGEGVPQDDRTAFEWSKKSANQGDSDGLLNYAICFYYGYGTPEDKQEAYKWFKKAAQKDNVESYVWIGRIFINGEVVEKNDFEAFKWFMKAAEQGDADGQNCVSVCYSYGFGVDQDYSEARRWNLKAAEQGHLNAQFGMGEMYRYGRGVNVDTNMARMWYKKAAEQGFEDAIKALEDLDRQIASSSNTTSNKEPSNSGCMIVILVIIVSSFVMSFAF